MAILVTGGAGFVGSHLVDLLLAQGHEVIIVDNFSTGSRQNINPRAEVHLMDVASPELERIFESRKIQYVCHLAAQASVAGSTSDPVGDASTNVVGSINVFNLSRSYGVEKVLFSSTAAVYGDVAELPVLETHPTRPMSCYGLSKLSAEAYLMMLHPNAVVLRCANIFGPRQGSGGEAGVVSIFIERMLDKKVVRINGDGQQTRDFIYVEDVAQAFLAALNSNVSREIINVSTSTQVSVDQLWQALNQIIGGQARHFHTAARLGDIRYSCLSNEKAKQLLSWSPQISLLEGLRRTVEFNAAAKTKKTYSAV